MAVVKGNLLTELQMMQEEMNRLFDLSRSRLTGESLESGTWEPPADILEDEREIVVKMEIPEVDLEDMDIRTEEGILLIKGERKPESAEGENSYLRVERSYGRFQRAFTLTADVRRDEMAISCDRGVLKIVLSKIQSEKTEK